MSQGEFGFTDHGMPPYDESYDALTRFWPIGHLIEGELKAKTYKAFLVDETWIPASQVEAQEIRGDRAKLIVSDWFFKLSKSENGDSVT